MNLFYNNAMNANRGIWNVLHEVQPVFACDRLEKCDSMEPPYIHGD